MDSLKKNLLKKSRDELVDILEDLDYIEERDGKFPAQNYTPNGKAEKFIEMVGSGKNYINMFIGANGTSKTATGANIVANICYGVQNDWFDHELFQRFPHLKRGRIISDPTTIKEKIIPELEKWFPRKEAERLPHAEYETLKEGKTYTSKFRTKSGWTIDLMSNEQDAKEFESVDLGFVWIDEPMPKDRFMATIARGRLGMIIFWTFTPLFYSAWIKDWIDAQREVKDYIGIVEAEMEDNCKKHGMRGFFEHKHIKRIVDSYPEDEKQARVFGKFGHLIGRVHKGFKREIHVIKPFPINETDFTSYIAVDPHPRVEDHALWASVDKNGTIYITAELLSEGLVEVLQRRILDMEAGMKFRIEERIIDPSAYVDDQHREKASVGSQLYDMGLDFIKGSKDLMACIKRTDEALNYEMKNGVMVREPEVYIFESCPVLIKQLEEYVWSERKGGSKDERQDMGRPKDINDHNVENLHRLLIHDLRFIPYERRRSGSAPRSAEGGPLSSHDPYDKQ